MNIKVTEAIQEAVFHHDEDRYKEAFRSMCDAITLLNEEGPMLSYPGECVLPPKTLGEFKAQVEHLVSKHGDGTVMTQFPYIAGYRISPK